MISADLTLDTRQKIQKKLKRYTERVRIQLTKKTINDALKKAGFELQIKDGFLTLFFDQSANFITSTRMAGRKPSKTYVKFSDVVYMQQIMKIKEIIEKLGMSMSSYYRHDIRMKKTYYYKQIDKSRLNDIEYLKSVDGNWSF